jgi:hypothetical protein
MNLPNVSVESDNCSSNTFNWIVNSITCIYIYIDFTAMLIAKIVQSRTTEVLTDYELERIISEMKRSWLM